MQEDLYLIIGCFGRIDSEYSSNFVSCGGVENRILNVNETLDNYDSMMDYFEGLRLFDKPIFDYNAIRHIVSNMQERYDQKFKRLWSEKYYHLIERFTVTHRPCGIYVKLILVNSLLDEKTETEPEQIVVKGSPELPNKVPVLKVIRGRR